MHSAGIGCVTWSGHFGPCRLDLEVHRATGKVFNDTDLSRMYKILQSIPQPDCSNYSPPRFPQSCYISPPLPSHQAMPLPIISAQPPIPKAPYEVVHQHILSPFPSLSIPYHTPLPPLQTAIIYPCRRNKRSVNWVWREDRETVWEFCGWEG